MSEAALVKQLEAQLSELHHLSHPSVALVDQLNELAERDEVDFPRRLALSEEAYIHATVLEYPLGRIRSLVTQGQLHRGHDQAQALTKLFEALSLLQTTPDPFLEATAYFELGSTCTLMGQFSEALGHLLEAIRLYRAINDTKNEARTLNKMGVAHVFMGQPQKAIAFYQQALAIHQAHDNKGECALVLNNLAHAYHQQGDREQARVVAEASLKLAEELRQAGEYVDWYTHVLDTLSCILRDIGEIERAEYYTHRAHEENVLPDGTFRHNNVETSIFSNLAFYARVRGDFERAQRMYEEMLAFGIKHDLKRDQVEALEALASLHQEQGEAVAALQLLRRSHQLKREIFGERNAQRAQALQVTFETETTRREATVLQSRNEELAQMVTALEQAKVQLQVSLTELERRTGEQRRLLEANELQRRTIHDLSVPVLPLTSDVLVMPLVGVLSTTRLRQVCEQALAAIQRTGASYLLLDITGVPVVDTEVAHGLITTVQSVRLLGAKTYLVGIRPEVAQAIIGLGLDLQGMSTTTDLRTALRALIGTLPYTHARFANGYR